MAVSAQFIADFASFKQAVDEAEVKLTSFQSGANRVGQSLQRMADSFSGRKILQDAELMQKAIGDIGNVSQLTDAEMRRVNATATEAIEKMTRLGVQVPPGLRDLATATKGAATESAGLLGSLGQVNGILGYFGAALTVGAVVNFGRQVLEAGDQIQKMADQTNLSADKVQRLQYIASQAGSNMGAMITAVQDLQVRLGDDDKGTIAALRRLNINLDAFTKLDAYDQMVALSNGLRDINDPAEQAATAADLFGRAWKEILPALKSDMEEVGRAAPKMSADSVKALDDLGDALSYAKDAAIAWGGTFIAELSKTGDKVGDFISSFNPEHFGRSTSELLKMYGAINDPDGLKGALHSVIPPTLAFGDALKVQGLSASEDAALLKELTRQVEENVRLHKQWSDATAQLADVGGDWRATLQGMNGDTVDAIKYYLEAGVAQGTLATAYGATAGQVQAVAAALREEQQQLAAVRTYWDQVGGVVDRVLGADKVKQATLWKDAIDALGGDVSKLANEDLAALQDAMVAGIDALGRQGQLTSDQASAFATLAAAAAAARAAIADKTTATDSDTTSTDANTNAQDRLGDKLKKVNDELDKVPPKASAAATSMRIAFETVPTAESLTLAGLNPGSMLGLPRGPMVQSMIGAGSFPVRAPAWASTYLAGQRAEGGPVSAGQPYLVGERGAELFVPAMSGSVVPNRGAVTFEAGAIQLVYPIMNDPNARTQLARLIDDAIVKRLTGSGVRV